MGKGTGKGTGKGGDGSVLENIGGVGKGGVLFGPGVVAGWIDQTKTPGTTSQTEYLGFKSTLRSVVTLNYFIWSPNLVWFAIALSLFMVFPYDLESVKAAGVASATAWLTHRFALNYFFAFCYYGFFHYGLYIANWGTRKFVPGSYPTMSNMAHNLYYWSLAIVQWTFWEYAMCRIWASGGADFATNAQILADPKLLALNIFWVLAIPIWRDLHFYMAHRFIHIRAVYKFVHSLHHRNADPEPFSGMCMHPVEHLYYFSNAFTPSLYLSGLSPLIFLWNFVHLTYAPGAGHSGWEDNWQADQYHFVHHAKFECNYGSPFSAFIDQYFGTFREKLGDSKAYRGASDGSNVDDEAATVAKKKKNDDAAPKVWSATGHLGMPQNWAHGVYSVFWVALFPLTWWGAIANHSGEDGQLLQPMLGKVPTATAVASIVAYSPVAMALLLCVLSGDKMSWRWPFQKESVIGTFGLFLVLGWLVCILPIYHATLAICEPMTAA